MTSARKMPDNSETLLYVCITAVTTLLFSLGYYFIEVIITNIRAFKTRNFLHPNICMFFFSSKYRIRDVIHI